MNIEPDHQTQLVISKDELLYVLLKRVEKLEREVAELQQFRLSTNWKPCKPSLPVW